MQGLGHTGAEQLRRLLGAVVAVGSGLELSVVLERIVETAVELIGATYGALGVLDPSGTHLVDFVTVGLTDEQRERIGELPRGHGILGLLIVEPVAIRLPDLAQHPDSYGFPPGHPPMTSFLGVPLFVRGEIYGNLYLTDKADGEEFTEVDEEMASGLAKAAAIAIDNARLHERARDLDLIRDRERIARDLHDTVIQRLFATGLSLQAATRLIDQPDIRARVETAVDDLDETVREIRTSIFDLQRADVVERGPRRALLRLGEELTEAIGKPPSFRFDGPIDTVLGPEEARHLLAVVREALSNVAHHAPSSKAMVAVTIAAGWLEVVVTDSGPGPGPARSSGRGLANLASRAEELGGTSLLEGAPGGGSRLHWRVPLALGSEP